MLHHILLLWYFFDFTAALFCPALSNEAFSVMTYSNAATNGYFHYWLNWPIFFLTNCLVYKMLENKTWMKIPFSFSQSLRWHWQIACVVKPTAQIILFTLTLKWWKSGKVSLSACHKVTVCLKKKSVAVIFFSCCSSTIVLYFIAPYSVCTLREPGDISKRTQYLINTSELSAQWHLQFKGLKT